MDYKQIILSLIEFNTTLQGWLDDYSSGNLYDEEKSIDWNDGSYKALEEIKDALEELGLFLTDEEELDLFRLDDLEED